MRKTLSKIGLWYINLWGNSKNTCKKIIKITGMYFEKAISKLETSLKRINEKDEGCLFLLFLELVILIISIFLIFVLHKYILFMLYM